MKNIITKFNRNFMPKMAVFILVAGMFSVGLLAMPHKTFAQYDDGSGWSDAGFVSDGYAPSDNSYIDAGYNSGYGDNGSTYSDPCAYSGCDNVDVYDAYPTNCDTCNTYDSYGSYGCDYSCYDSGSSYGSYGCNTCYSMPSYYSYSTPSYSTPSYNYNSNSNHSTNTNFNYANSNSSSSATATNNNNSPINVVVNVPPSNNPTPTQNLTAYCTASPSNPLIGNQVAWQGYASGGNGNYTYNWSGDVSGSGQTVYNTYYNAGTRNAYLTVTSNGQQVSANCSVNVQPNGATVSSYSVYQQPTITGTPSAGVFLSQIPATGITPGLKMILFVLGLFMWSAFGAYMILQKRKLGTLATVGVSASEMDIETPEVETLAENETETEAEPMDLESNLSFRARENNVLISRDGIAAIMARSGNDQGTATSILNQLMSKVSRNEGDYATLNSQKVNQLLA